MLLLDGQYCTWQMLCIAEPVKRRASEEREAIRISHEERSRIERYVTNNKNLRTRDGVTANKKHGWVGLAGDLL